MKELILDTRLGYSMFNDSHQDKPTEKGIRVNPKKAIKAFRNKINFSLQKHTFDATHMDKILNTEFCRTKTGEQNNSSISKNPHVSYRYLNKP